MGASPQLYCGAAVQLPPKLEFLRKWLDDDLE